ncbi:MAG: hypothetical protein WBL20_17070, partial [Sphingobium sp.]
MHIHSNVVSIFPPGAQPEGRCADLSLPTLPVSTAPAADVDMAEIARRLGIADQAWETIIAKVRLLNERYGFPTPRTPRIVKRQLITGPRAIVRRSRFPRARVEEWFDNHRSPAQGAAEDAGEARAAASTLAAN